MKANRASPELRRALLDAAAARCHRVVGGRAGENEAYEDAPSLAAAAIQALNARAHLPRRRSAKRINGRLRIDGTGGQAGEATGALLPLFELRR